MAAHASCRATLLRAAAPWARTAVTARLWTSYDVSRGLTLDTRLFDVSVNATVYEYSRKYFLLVISTNVITEIQRDASPKSPFGHRPSRYAESLSRRDYFRAACSNRWRTKQALTVCRLWCETVDTVRYLPSTGPWSFGGLRPPCWNVALGGNAARASVWSRGFIALCEHASLRDIRRTSKRYCNARSRLSVLARPIREASWRWNAVEALRSSRLSRLVVSTRAFSFAKARDKRASAGSAVQGTARSSCGINNAEL